MSKIGNSRFRVARGIDLPKPQPFGGVVLAQVGIILDNLSESAYRFPASPSTGENLAPKTDEEPMSFRTNSCFAAEIPSYAAPFPCFRQEQGIHVQGLDRSRDQAARAARKEADPAEF